MWTVKNRTPYAASGAWGRDKNGVHEWIVAIKATYDIKRNGSLTIADQQPEPLPLPEYWGEPGLSSLRYDVDLDTLKPTTDVLVNGTAYAPNGRKSKAFRVSVRVGQIFKEIGVVGNRKWEAGMLGLHPSPVTPVTEVPIRYERAFGGFDQSDPDPKRQQMDKRNPVGCGLVAKEGDALPNFEQPSQAFEKAGPAGFGAIASYWSPRLEVSGTYDDAWRQTRYPLLPRDWNNRSLLCSPLDQLPERPLEGGELVELTNLTPDGQLRFVLPKLKFSFRTFFSLGINQRPADHSGRLASVIIEPDFPRVILVWSTTLPCRKDGDYLEETLVRETRPV